LTRPSQGTGADDAGAVLLCATPGHPHPHIRRLHPASRGAFLEEVL